MPGSILQFVPRILTAGQKQQRVNVCTELRRLAFDDKKFLSSFITGDESRIYGYDPETATILPVKKPTQAKSNLKSMIITL